MSIWKQAGLTLAVLLIAAACWVRFFPGSTEILARAGIGEIPLLSPAAPVAKAESGAGERGGGGGLQSAVITAPVIELTINDRLSAIGTGRAVRSVSVKPYAGGRMIELAVQSGSTVRKGDIIARLDSEVQEIAVDRASIAVKDAEARVARIEALRSSNTASAVQLTEATLALDNARLALRDAQLELDRRAVEAPIDGIVGILPITAGNYVTTDTVIATIDDRSEILVDFWVAERFASMVSVGSQLSATSVARPGEAFEGSVSAVDNRIDSASRTLQVQARIANDDDRLRAGMSFQVSMRFPGDNFPAVDPLAVQWGTDGAYVWVIRDGRAERVAIRIVQRNTDSVLVDAPLSIEDTVVTEGIHVVREGAEVRIASRQAPAPSERPANGS